MPPRSTTTRSTPHADHDAEDQARPDRRRQRRDAGAIGQAAQDRLLLPQYPLGPLFAQPVGYSNLSGGQSAGLEKYRLDDLKGPSTTLNSVFGPLGGNQTWATTSTPTWIPRPSAQARQELAGRPGSVVALDPRTGAVLTMYSNPSYDDNHPNAPCPDACQLNRATQGQYPPGSTFKVVTATAGDRQRQVHPRLAHQRRLPQDDLRRAAAERQQPELRSDHPDQGADRQRQHRLRPGGRERRAPDDDQVHEALRLLRAAADRPSQRRAAHEPALSTSRAGRSARRAPTRTSAASGSARAGSW